MLSMGMNILPNISYSMCINKEFIDSEKALEMEEKYWQKEFDAMVFPPQQDQGYKPLGFGQGDEEEEEEEEEDIEMGGSDREFDEYDHELETSDVDQPQ